MAIQNKYSYVLAILMRQNAETVKPDLNLEKSVRHKLIQGT